MFLSGRLTSNLILVLTCAAITNASAQDTVIQIPDIEIIGTTPLPGTGVPVEDVPSKVQTFDAKDFQDSYALDLSSLLEMKIWSAKGASHKKAPGTEAQNQISARHLGPPYLEFQSNRRKSSSDSLIFIL